MKIRSESLIQKKPEDLQPYPFNARKHSDWQINSLAKMIREVGYIDPVIVDENDMVLAGHARVMAAMKVGMPLIPTITVVGLSTSQKKAYVLAANRLAENATWDESLLQQEIGAIFAENNEFDFSSIGFNKDEMDQILESIKNVDLPSNGDNVELTDDSNDDGEKINKTQYQFVIKCDSQQQLFELRDRFNVTRSSVSYSKFMEFISVKEGGSNE
jgi:hypothetical protein